MENVNAPRFYAHPERTFFVLLVSWLSIAIATPLMASIALGYPFWESVVIGILVSIASGTAAMLQLNMADEDGTLEVSFILAVIAGGILASGTIGCVIAFFLVGFFTGFPPLGLSWTLGMLVIALPLAGLIVRGVRNYRFVQKERAYRHQKEDDEERAIAERNEIDRMERKAKELQAFQRREEARDFLIEALRIDEVWFNEDGYLDTNSLAEEWIARQLRDRASFIQQTQDHIAKAVSESGYALEDCGQTAMDLQVANFEALARALTQVGLRMETSWRHHRPLAAR